MEGVLATSTGRCKCGQECRNGRSRVQQFLITLLFVMKLGHGLGVGHDPRLVCCAVVSEHLRLPAYG